MNVELAAEKHAETYDGRSNGVDIVLFTREREPRYTNQKKFESQGSAPNPNLGSCIDHPKKSTVIDGSSRENPATSEILGVGTTTCFRSRRRRRVLILAAYSVATETLNDSGIS